VWILWASKMSSVAGDNENGLFVVLVIRPIFKEQNKQVQHGAWLIEIRMTNELSQGGRFPDPATTKLT